jgi:glycosyltransferase involved in cell wall biosynthesis
MKPILFVTSYAPPDRVGAFQALHEREGTELALFGGRSLHGVGAGDLGDGASGPDRETHHPDGRAQASRAPASREAPGPAQTLSFPHRRVDQCELGRLAAGGHYRAVVVSTGGRLALPLTWAGARRAGVPLILWASLWAHPRSATHALSYPPLRRLYRSADAVVTYGPHVSAYVRARGARNVHIAPQSVDNDFWRADVDPSAAARLEPRWPTNAEVVFMFGGRAAREKGLGVLLEAWSASGLGAPAAALVLVGVGSSPPWVPAGGAVSELDGVTCVDGVTCLDPVDAVQMRNFYAASDVLVLPSIRTRTFREPWGLVVNEAMNRHLPVIVSDAVGAAAGGLVRNDRNGLVVPAEDPVALAGAMRTLASDAALRARLSEAGSSDVLAYSHVAWAEGFSRALASIGVSSSVSPSAGAGSVRRP